ncbi:hypothetical protein ATO00_04820 [Loigolactobacillus coryniformis subsp. coryniformis]|nr:hypothetical protein ATO00_04820 [Loigolactobacillus coryniformis subsp. coryniformis]
MGDILISPTGEHFVFHRIVDDTVTTYGPSSPYGYWPKSRYRVWKYLDQIDDFRANLLPLFPDILTQSVLEPLIQLMDKLLHVTNAIIVEPASHYLANFVHNQVKTTTAITFGDLL